MHTEFGNKRKKPDIFQKHIWKYTLAKQKETMDNQWTEYEIISIKNVHWPINF